MATNAAMVLARPAGRNPREIADVLAARLGEDPRVLSAEVAGPGFINLRLAPVVWQGMVAAILSGGADFGRSGVGGGRKVNVEFVSANPTGPMHVGHTRGAVVGDALARLLAFAGWQVTLLPLPEPLVNLASALRADLIRQGRRTGDRAEVIGIDDTASGIDIHDAFDFYLAEKALEWFAANGKP
jgi:hypothetical protein